MLNRAKTIVRPIVQTFRRTRARRACGRLQSHTDSRVRAIGDALENALTGSGADDARSRVDAIEDRRQEMLASSTVIDVVDYGAGSSISHRSRAEMDEGVLRSRSLAEVCNVSKSPFWANFLMLLVRQLGPTSAVELGTCVGISASYQGLAMEMNGGGRLVTLEGSPEIAQVARETLAAVDVDATVVTGPFHQTLADVLENAAPVDYFFNDGHHEHDAVLRYFAQSLPWLADDAVVVLDDISWSPGMKKAWTEVADHPRVAVAIDLRTFGILVLGSPDGKAERFRIPV